MNQQRERDYQQLLVDVTFVEESWPSLCELRIPGTPRPWRQAMLDPERRAVLAERDRLERAVRDPDAPGFTSAPEHIDVLDVMVEVWLAFGELLDRLRPHPITIFEHAQRREISLDGMLWRIRTWLPDAWPHRQAEIEKTAGRIERLAAEITRVLSLVRARQLLTGALCPWCHGITPKTPAGGATTMRVEEIVKAKPADKTTGRPATEAVFAVVCWNDLCEPTAEECGTVYRKHPAWPSLEWDWLAERLTEADALRAKYSAIVIDTPSLLTETEFTTQRIEHNGRSGVDQAAELTAAAGVVLDGSFSKEKPPAPIPIGHAVPVRTKASREELAHLREQALIEWYEKVAAETRWRIVDSPRTELKSRRVEDDPELTRSMVVRGTVRILPAERHAG